MPKDDTYNSYAEALADTPQQKGKRKPEKSGGITGSEEARIPHKMHVRHYRQGACREWSGSDLKAFEERVAKGIKMVREGKARIAWGEFAYVEIQEEA